MATTLFNKTALANGTSNLIVRSHALNLSTDLVQAGVVFNDAVRDSLGLFNTSGSGNQNPFLSSYTTDIKAVENDIAAMLANPGNVTLGGATFTLNATDTAALTNIEGQLASLLTAAAQTTNAATMSAAEQTIHALQNEILQEVNGDAHLSAALNQVTYTATTGATDVAFQTTPAGADDAGSVAAAAAGNSLHAVGTVFNAAADLAAAAALVSSLVNAPLPTDAVYFGEISLSGAVRPVAQTSARLKEAAKLGFGRAVLPESARGEAGGDAGMVLNTVGGLTSLVADIAARAPPKANRGDIREAAPEKNATPARFRRQEG